MSPMTAEWTDYESETLRQARELFANWRADDGDIGDVKLRLDGVPGDASLFVTFTHRDRPGCQFSYTWPLHGWNDDDPEEPDEEVPDNQVTLLRANLTEDLCALGYGLPTNCRPGEVVELGRPRIELELELAIGRVLEGYADRFDGSVVELKDKLIEAARPIAQQHVYELNGIVSAASVRPRQQQTNGPDTPQDR
jgi:hypothetical protein